MTDRTTTNGPLLNRGHERPTSPTQGVRQGVSGLLHDAISLGELQYRLLMLDLGEAAGRIVVPAGLLAVAGVLGLSAIPLLLVALAQVLRDQAGWPAALATLTAVGAGLLIAGLLAFVGYLKLKRIAKPFDRSAAEFSRNAAWLKDALRRQQRPDEPVVPNRPR